MQTQTLKILGVSLVNALPVLAIGDTVQVPGRGQQGLVPCWCNIFHLVLVFLLVSFPNVDNCVWFQLHGTHTSGIQCQKEKEGRTVAEIWLFSVWFINTFRVFLCQKVCRIQKILSNLYLESYHGGPDLFFFSSGWLIKPKTCTVHPISAPGFIWAQVWSFIVLKFINTWNHQPHCPMFIQSNVGIIVSQLCRIAV